MASLLDQEVQVPQDWIVATVSVRKQFKSIGGTAGRKRRRLIEERTCDKKVIDFKIKYLTVAGPPAPKAMTVVPSPDEVVMPSSDEDFQV